MDAECPLPTRPLCVRTSCLPFLCRLTRILSLSLSLSLSVAENNSVELILYDIVARKEVQRLPHKAAVLTSLYVDHKGKKYIVVSTCDYVLTVWDTQSGPRAPPPLALPPPPPASPRSCKPACCAHKGCGLGRAGRCASRSRVQARALAGGAGGLDVASRGKRDRCGRGGSVGGIGVRGRVQQAGAGCWPDDGGGRLANVAHVGPGPQPSFLSSAPPPPPRDILLSVRPTPSRVASPPRVLYPSRVPTPPCMRKLAYALCRCHHAGATPSLVARGRFCLLALRFCRISSAKCCGRWL